MIGQDFNEIKTTIEGHLSSLEEEQDQDLRARTHKKLAKSSFHLYCTFFFADRRLSGRLLKQLRQSELRARVYTWITGHDISTDARDVFQGIWSDHEVSI